MTVVHTFNVNTFGTFHTEKEKINEKIFQNSDQGERQDHFMISCYTVIRPGVEEKLD